MREIVPAALVAGVWALLWCRARLSSTAQGSLVFTRLLLALLLPISLLLNWWAFTSLETFPLVFTILFAVFAWLRPSLGTTPIGRLAGARWAPLAAAVLLIAAARLISGTLDLSPLAFAPICLLPFPFDRERVGRFLSSVWATPVFAALITLAGWWIQARLDLVPLLIGGLLSLLRFDIRRAERVLDSRWMPPILGTLSGLAVLSVWGSLHSVAAVHDEDAYLLQARLFARGHWAAPAPPMPEFFEQFHVLVTPVFASKYPPGHSLVLTPGIWLGLPGLVPMALTGLAALVFTLARRLGNGWVALLAWLVWAIAPGSLFYRSSYFSEVTTSALWLTGWWALLNWRDRARTRWLLLLAACAAWCLITRPLTGVAFAIPTGLAVLRLAWTRRAWREVMLAVAVGAGVLSILPIWSTRTTGDWKTTPLFLYTRQYMPYDAPGFGPTRQVPQRPLPPELEKLNLRMADIKKHHVVAAIPGILRTRLWTIGQDMWGWPNRYLALFALLGLAAAGPEAILAFATAVLLVLSYLTYWHPSGWCVYYIEIQPVLAFLTALGVWRFLGALAKFLPGLLTRQGAEARSAARDVPAVVAVVFAAVLAASSTIALWSVRVRVDDVMRTPRSFQSALEPIRHQRAIVFVRYKPDHDGNRSLVINEADLARARVWVVHDRGPENEKLLKLVPDRKPYVYDEARRRLLPLAPAVSSAPL